MATYDTLTSLLTAIANAIRSKTGETNTINAQNFPSKILSILQGSGNAKPSDVLSGKTFTNNSGEQTGTMANKGAWGTTINPGGSVTIPSGFHNGGGVVKANAIHNTIISETLNPSTNSESSKTYTLTTGKRYFIVIKATNTSQDSCFTKVYINGKQVADITNDAAYENINFVPSKSNSLVVGWQRNAKPIVRIINVL